MCESADRALKNKFKHCTPERLDSLQNAAGERPVDWVEAEMIRNKATHQKIKTSFWLALEKEFNLATTTAHPLDRLPEPTEAEAVSKELFDAIQQTVNKNPGSRKVGPFASFLEYNRGLSESEIYGMLVACKPQLHLFPNHRVQMEQLAVQKLAEEDVPTRFPRTWERVRDWTEQVMKTKWLDNTRVGRDAFVSGNRGVLVLLLDAKAIDIGPRGGHRIAFFWVSGDNPGYPGEGEG